MMAFPQQFYNPGIPFTGTINGGLQVGKSITISGWVQPGADRFHVNLQCGSNTNADIALHFNPRYDSLPGYVVANTFQHGRWATEERKQNFPLPTGSAFNLLITVTSASYQMNINGTHFMEYKHRISFFQVNTIAIDGKVDISSITFSNPMFAGQPAFPAQPRFPPQPTFPSHVTYPNQAGFPPCPGFPPLPGFPSRPRFRVPYKAIISGRYKMGRLITILGTVCPNATRFSVNLNHPFGIALHYNPCFNENVVVRNTKHGENWDSEERDGPMPFHKGQPFTLTICCKKDSFGILVNGMPAHTYRHRFTHLQLISELEIDGDISITSVKV
ncbi:galectin-9-like [Syngnathus typhle]